MKSFVKNRFVAGMLALAMMITTWMPTEPVKAAESSFKGATNITFGAARDLQFNTSIAEEASENDAKRYYKFTVNEASELNVNIAKQNYNTIFQIQVYDASKTKVFDCYRSRSNGDAGVSTDSIYLTGGQYYLEIYVTGNYAAYSFIATIDSLGESFKETQDSNNDVVSSASSIKLKKKYKGVLAQNDEVDYYKFTIPAAGKINYSMSNATDGILKYEIYDKSLNAALISDVKSGGKAAVSATLAKGTYYLKITKYSSNCGVGSYTYTIDHVVSKPKAPKIKSVKNSGKKKMTVKWSKVSGVDGYELQYSTSKNFKKSVVKKNLSASKTSVNYSKLKKGKTYYVRMRSYVKVNNSKKYSSWCTKKSVKIRK